MENLIPKGVANKVLSVFNLLSKLIALKKINPNIITISGIPINILGGYLYSKGYVQIAGLIVLLASFTDILDGQVAKLLKKESKFGSVFDSTLDRYSEIIIFTGLILFFIKRSENLYSFLTFLALTGSIMVSYVKARAEGAGIPISGGFFKRAERIILLSVCSILGIDVLKIFLYIITFTTHLTAVQRLILVYKKERIETLNRKEEQWEK
ncbi:MAG: CDP-alcohol phosphatidyltransferase family protein [Acidobacteriota bacterium]